MQYCSRGQVISLPKPNQKKTKQIWHKYRSNQQQHKRDNVCALYKLYINKRAIHNKRLYCNLHNMNLFQCSKFKFLSSFKFPQKKFIYKALIRIEGILIFLTNIIRLYAKQKNYFNKEKLVSYLCGFLFLQCRLVLLD